MSFRFVFAEGNFCRFASESFPTKACNCAHQRFFDDRQDKKLLEQLKLWSQWMKCGESWMPTCTSMCDYAPTWANIAVCQLCRERQPLWNSHDGLNLTCLDQCHGVRSPGTSSSQGWRKRIVVQSKFGPWVYILVFAEGNFFRFA